MLDSKFTCFQYMSCANSIFYETNWAVNKSILYFNIRAPGKIKVCSVLEEYQRLLSIPLLFGEWNFSVTNFNVIRCTFALVLFFLAIIRTLNWLWSDSVCSITRNLPGVNLKKKKEKNFKAAPDFFGKGL